MSTLKQLGNRIRQLRELKGLTQEQLEEKSGINAKYISALERGTRNATIELLQKIAAGLDVEIFILFCFGDDLHRTSQATLKKFIDTIDPDYFGKTLQILKIMSNK